MLHILQIGITFIGALLLLWDYITHTLPHPLLAVLGGLSLFRAGLTGDPAPYLIGGLIGFILPLLLFIITDNWDDLGGGDVWLMACTGLFLNTVFLSIAVLLSAITLWFYEQYAKKIKPRQMVAYPLAVPMMMFSIPLMWITT